MRVCYLIRHGEPDFPGGVKTCLGRLDLPLSETGTAQARRLGAYFRPLMPLRVISSPLQRCRQTAAAISREVETSDGLMEVDMGAWDGLPFDEIRARWPELYRLRGQDMFRAAPPGGESFQAAGIRAMAALREILEKYPDEDLIVVAHNGINRALSAGLAGQEVDFPFQPQPYASILPILLDGDQVYPGRCVLPEDLPEPVPDRAECLALLNEYGTPVPAIRHGSAVARKAEELCVALQGKGIVLNAGLIRAGALLHDMAKGAPRHAVAGAQWLRDKGYPAVAAVVGSHMRMPPGTVPAWSEKTVVYLADKLVRGTQAVTLEERFFPDGAQPCPFAVEQYRIAGALWSRLQEK